MESLPRNILNNRHIEKIIKIIKEPKDIKFYSKVVNVDEVTKNDYDLSFSNYIEEFNEKILNNTGDPFLRFHSIITTYQKKYINKNIVFRGMCDAEWELKPSVGRLDIDDSQRESIERNIFEQFKQQALPYLDFTPRNEWEWLALAQHHGLPTRLLDWTINPLIALYFSVENDNSDKDSVVWIYIDDDEPIDIEFQETYGGNIIHPYSNPLKIPGGNNAMRFIPAHLNKRIIAQSGLFTVHSNPTKPFSPNNIFKIVIPSKIRGKLKEQLFKYGVHEGVVYPDLDGLSRKIKWLNIKPN